MLALFDAVHLPHGEKLLERYPHQISGGMCQRVLIAMAFAGKPRLVIADEPTTALDVTIQARIVRLIAEMQKRDNTAVVFITHDLRLATHVCDDILVLYAGRPAEYGPARSVFSAPAHPYTRCLQLASPPMSGARRALQSLPERMPGLRAWKDITGCAFAPRCPIGIPQCHATPPPFEEIEPGHKVACIRPAETRSIMTPPLSAGAAAAERAPVLEAAGLWKTFAVGAGCFAARHSPRCAMSASRSTRTNFSASSVKAAAARPRWRACWSGWNSLPRCASHRGRNL